MSFKLQDRIQRIKGLPKKYKGLLLAMASHARNDGTNVIAAKATLAAEMGVVRFTVNRNMDALLVAGLVVEAETHTCRNDFCPKGSRHYTEHGNHWTQAYSLDLVALQNVTPLSRRVVAHFVTESRHILHQSGVTFCAAKQGLYNPAALGHEKASVLTNGNEGKKEDSVSSIPETEQQPQFATDEQTKPEKLKQSKVLSPVEAAWVDGGGAAFMNGDAEAAEHMLKTGAHASVELIAYIRDTFACPKTARIAWKDFSYWARPENFDLTKRNIDAWRRLKKAKLTDSASKTNPNCARCNRPTYGSPTYENDKPFCADCMGLPSYRRESGQRQIFTRSDI